MTDSVEVLLSLGRRISADLAEFANPDRSRFNEPAPLDPDADLLGAFDARITDADLRAATRSRFVTKHYADAIEAGVKTLNECVRVKSGRVEDGDELMTTVFSLNKPLLRINKLRSKTDQSEQRGHMQLCQGVVAAWRNPRAHSLFDDSPARTLMMLELIDDLIAITKSAVRTRARR